MEAGVQMGRWGPRLGWGGQGRGLAQATTRGPGAGLRHRGE